MKRVNHRGRLPLGKAALAVGLSALAAVLLIACEPASVASPLATPIASRSPTPTPQPTATSTPVPEIATETPTLMPTMAPPSADGWREIRSGVAIREMYQDE
ncbi:MAG TPA: hypothetical protein VFK30_13190, partial [Anaerolineae bacterium]|nr:hypothetical protein [Anaerolineae bacterium]